MRAAAMIAVLLASAAWVPVRDEAVVAGPGYAMREAPRISAARDVPAGWRGARQHDSGVLAQLWGGSDPAPGVMADAAIAERAARAFVGRHIAHLAPGSRLDDLVTITNRVDDRVRTVAFQQTWRGLRVIGGTVFVVFANDRLFAAGSQALPAVQAPLPRTTARASAARADAWVAAAAGKLVCSRDLGERVVVPLVDATGALVYRVADVREVATLDGRERWTVYLSPDGAPLLRESHVRRATGTLRYDAGVRRPGGARMAYAAANASVTVDGAAQTSGEDGLVTWAGTAAASVITGLAGPFVAVLDPDGELGQATLALPAGGAVTWAAPTDEFLDAQLSAFVHVSLGKVHARRILPELAPWLDTPLQVFVNEPGDCNASAAANALTFHRRGAGCENTGRLADVVYHELGHAVHLAGIIDGVGAFQPSLSEGLSDFFAANIVDDPGIGRGFRLDDRAIRDLDPAGYELVYPDDAAPTPHGTGLIVAGALWDLRKAFIAEYGTAAGVELAERIYAGLVRRAPNLPGAYLAAQIADDDDGDLGNGTPHGCAIQAAFGKHGLAEPAFETTRVGVPVVDGLTLTVPVTTPTGTACPVPQVTSVTVTFHADGARAQTFALAASGAAWTGAFPAQPPHTLLAYSVTATLDDQSTVTYPRNPADPSYQLFVGPVDELWCERFDGDPAWMQAGAATWEVAAPRLSTSGDPSMPFSGALVLGTQVTGTGAYTSNATTSISTPPIDVTGYSRVRLQYRRWLTVEDARYDRAEIAVGGTTLWTNADSPEGTLDHRDREWRFHDVDVTAHAAAPLAVTWSLTSDANRQLGGWTLDDVCLVGYGKRATCGDDVLDDGETCDDGNTTPDDGCDPRCQLEPEDPGCCSAGGAPTSPLLLVLGVLAALSRRRADAARGACRPDRSRRGSRSRPWGRADRP